MELARIQTARNFMLNHLKMDPLTLEQVTIMDIWPDTVDSCLIVKFSCKLDVEIINSFKKNLGASANVSDVIPPCCYPMFEYLKKIGNDLRTPGSSRGPCKIRII